MFKSLFVVRIKFKLNYSLYTVLSDDNRHSKVNVFASILSIQISTSREHSPLVTNDSLHHLANRSTGSIPATTSQVSYNLFSA